MFCFLFTSVFVLYLYCLCYLLKHLLKWWGCLVWSGHFWHYGRLNAGSRQLLQARNFYYPFHIIDQYRHHHLILVVSILKKSPSSALCFKRRHQKNIDFFVSRGGSNCTNDQDTFFEEVPKNSKVIIMTLKTVRMVVKTTNCKDRMAGRCMLWW